MFKTLGIVMIFLSCLLFSCEKVTALKVKLDHLKEMRKALMAMKNEISFSSQDLSLAMKELSVLLSDDMASFFNDISLYLTEYETADFSTAWETVKENYGFRPFLSDKGDRIMTDFSKELGKLPKDAEIEHIEKTLEILALAIADEEEMVKQNSGPIYVLSACAGVFVIILFI